MSAEILVGGALILVPLAFNVAFFELGRTFDYPDILRRPPGEILERFALGGTPLVVRWWLFMFTAALMVPLVVLVGLVLAAGSPGWLVATATVTGVLAGLVQVLGLVRWPFVVPELARRYRAAGASDTDRAGVGLVFATLHRLLGVAIGEHLGYLFTGAWTLLVGASILAGSGRVLPGWLGLLALPIGVAQLVGAFEFVGANERDGWSFAGRLVPIAYVAWSAWLVAFGVVLLVS